MITEPRVALTERQRALATAIERIAAAAEREQRDLSEQELAHIGALAAEVATLTRAINLGTDVAASAASGGVHRGHAPARGPPPSGDGESFLRWRQVRARTGLSRASIWRGVRTGTFPRPVQIMGPHAVGWLLSEIDRWIQSRVAQRDQHQPRRAPHSPGRPRKAVASATIRKPRPAAGCATSSRQGT
jgi:prophage regulatory protein